MTARLKAGAGKTEIKLPIGEPMAGYAARNGPAAGIHDPLYARIVLFDCDTKQHALVVLDLLKVEGNLITLIRKEINTVTGIPLDSITVTATHTHSGPAGMWDNSNNYNAALVTSLITEIAKLAREVWRNRVPVKLGIETGELHEVGRNRNNPDGPYDPAVGVIRIDSLEGRNIALIINYACHPTVLGENNRLFSRDFPGFTLDFLEKESTDGTPVAIFTNGAAGDISTRFTRKEATFTEARRFGELLAQEVLVISRALTLSSEWELNSFRKEVFLPVRQVSLQSTEEVLAEARKKLRAAESKGLTPGEIRTLQTTVQAAEIVMKRLVKEQEDLGGNDSAIPVQPENIPAEIEVIYFSEKTRAAIVVLPGEISSDIGQYMKEIIHEVGGVETKQVFIFGYGNGHIGYLPSPQSAKEPEYDSLMSKVDFRATELIAETVRSLGSKGKVKNAGK